jgi:endonuclease/exonuclease/phosphatase family metal-dependent hydrolase
MNAVRKNKQQLIGSIVMFFCFIVILNACSNKPVNKSNEMQLRFVSYNIHHCNPPADEKTGKIDVDAVAAVLKELNADVIALQEVDVNTKRSGNFHQAKLLADKLQMQFVFGKAIHYDGGEYGLAILSKYPLSNATVYRLPSDADTTAEPRILFTTTVTLPGNQQLLMGNTHLDVKAAGNRELQATTIASIAKQQKLPFVFAGDWNDHPGSTTLNILDKTFQRTCTACAVTCPEEGEKGIIDFIAFSRSTNASIIQYKVLPSAVSDHYPVVSDLKIRFSQ